MNKKNKLIALLLVFFCLSVGAFATLYELTRVQELAQGVKLIEKRKYMVDGWLDIFITEVDLSQPGVKIDSLVATEGFSNPQVVSKMASNAGALVGINGDFFAIGRTNAPTGSQVKSGKIAKTSPALSGTSASFALTKDKEPKLITPIFTTKVKFPNGNEKTIQGLNHQYDFTFSNIALYDRDWGLKSPGKDSIMTKDATDYVEVVVDSSGKVSKILSNEDGIEFPEGGFVLAASGNEAEYVRNNLKVGDLLSYSISANLDIDNIYASISGNPVLLDKGKIQTFTSGATDLHPRTAIGFSEDKKTVWFAVIDGRSARSRGYTYKEIAELFLELGAYTALNLDGGGSTTMAVRFPGSEEMVVVNNPSDGGERAVPNGFGVFVDQVSEAPFGAKIVLEPKDNRTVLDNEIIRLAPGTKRQFKALVYRNDGSLYENARISWKVSSDMFSIEDGLFVASKPGICKVSAFVDGTSIVAEQLFQVIGEPVSLEIQPSSIATNVGSKTPLKVIATDAEGFSVELSPDDVDWEIRGDIGSLDNGVFKAENNITAGVIVASFGDLKAASAVAVGSQKFLLSDFENPREWNLSVYPAEVKAKLDFTDEQVKSGSLAAKLSYDFTTTTRTRAAYLNRSVNIPGRPLQFGLWVYGDGNGHWLRGEFYDANRVAKIVNFADHVDWVGWKYVTADIPQDIDFPISLRRIYLVEAKAEKQDTGAIYFDDFEVIMPQEIPEELLEGFETIVEDPANRLIESIDPEKDDEFRFVVFGDSKVIADAPSSQGNIILKRSIDLINDEPHIDFAIYTGDLIEHDTDENYQAGLKALEPLNVPYKMVIANHEIAKTNNYKNFQKYFGDTRYSFRHKNSYFIVLNSAKGGLTLSEADQWLWLQEELDKVRDDNTIENVFLAMHIPTVDPNPGADTGFNELEGDLLERLLGEYRRTTKKNVWLFHGHVHGFARRIRDGVQYIDSAGSGSSLYLPAKMGGFYHYVVVTVKGDEITYQVYPIIDRINILEKDIVVSVGETVQFTAEAMQPFGPKFPLRYPAQAIWTISDSTIGTMDTDGTFIAKKAGTATVKVQSGIFSEETTITVK